MTLSAPQTTFQRDAIGDVLTIARRKVEQLVSGHPGQMPTYTENGRWYFDDDSWAPMWSGGFLAGMLWIFAEIDGDPRWREQAESYSRLLEPRKTDGGTHDLGFLFMPSWGRWHALAPTDQTRDVLIQAGRTLAARFNPHGRYIATWVSPSSTFIDVMPNIEIIYVAAHLAGDEQLADIATAHALTSRRYLVRGDGSTAHEGIFDPASGEFVRGRTHQGYRSDSSWARGQAWAVHGFGATYRWTGDERFLDAARRCADYYIAEVGERYVGPNDWDDPQPEFPYESSAASIAASAMLQLAGLDPAGRDRYADYARRILATLSTETFLGGPGDGWEGILRHAIYHRSEGIGVDESIMWGDYYFVDGLSQLLRSDDAAQSPPAR